MNLLKFVLACFVLLSFGQVCLADTFEEAQDSFKAVLDDIYKELGSPEVTEELMEKIDRELFIRPFDKKPALLASASIGWVDFGKSIIGTITYVTNNETKTIRVRWKPNQDLEILDPDEKLKLE